MMKRLYVCDGLMFEREKNNKKTQTRNHLFWDCLNPISSYVRQLSSDFAGNQTMH